MATKTQGRPAKFSDELLEKIALFKRLGCSDKYAAAAAGVGESTLAYWKVKHPKVRQILDQAVADGVAVNIGRMNEIASNGNMKAVQWLLHRFDPDDFPTDEYNININIRVEELSDEDLEKLAAGTSIAQISSPSRTGTEEKTQEATYTILDK